MYTSHYRSLFWGFIIVLIDINIGSIDILPDIIGYIMIIYQLNVLSDQNKNYSVASKLSIVLIITSILTIFIPTNNIINVYYRGINIPSLIINDINIIIDMFMIYYILQGIIELSDYKGDNELNDMAVFRRKVYLYLSFTILVLSPFTLNLHYEVFMVVYFLLGLSLFITYIMVISLINKAGKSIGEVITHK